VVARSASKLLVLKAEECKKLAAKNDSLISSRDTLMLKHRVEMKVLSLLVLLVQKYKY